MKTFLVTLVILVILIVTSAIIDLQVFSRVTGNTNAVAALQTEAATLQGQLTSVNSQMSSLANELATANSDISAVKTQVATDSSQISTDTGQLSTLSQQVSQASSAGSQVSTLQNQIATLQTDLSTLTSQVTSLQTTVNSLSVGGTTTTNTLFSGQPVSQNPGTYTLVYSFTPSYSGTLYVSGTSNSATAYILVVDSTYGTSNTYPFGSGTTVPAQLTAGNSYSIYFGNSDAVGTISASLTGTY